MYFSPRPQCNTKFLYGRSKELEQFKELLNSDNPLWLITGLRRTGKTSLIQTFFSQYKKYYIQIDARGLGSATNIDQSEVLLFFYLQIKDFLGKQKKHKKLKDFLERINGVTIGGSGFTWDSSVKSKIFLINLFQQLDTWAENEGEKLIIVIDEAQYLKQIVMFDISLIFAHIYDNYNNLKIILTGSEMGLIYKLIGREDPKSALYGRHIPEIKLNPLTKDECIKFLESGFKNECKILMSKSVNDVIENAATKLGSKMGWLTEFGIKCCNTKKVVNGYVDEIVNSGALLARREFNNFLKNKNQELYLDIMEYLANRGNKEFYDYFVKRSSTYQCLIKLIEEGFVYQEKKNWYVIVDFVLQHSLTYSDFESRYIEIVRAATRELKQLEKRNKKLNL